MAIWGSGYVAIKIGLANTTPVFFAAVRALSAGLFILLLNRIRTDAICHPKPKSLDWLYVFLFSLFCTAFFFWAMFTATPLTGAGLAAVLINTQPFFIAILARFVLGEAFGWKKYLFICVGFIGVLMIMQPGLDDRMNGMNGAHGESRFGMLILLAASVLFSAGLVMIKPLYRRLDLYWVTAWQLVFGGTILFALALATEDIAATRWTPGFIALTVYLSIVATSVTSLVWFRLIRFHPLGVVSAYGFLSPLFGVILSAIFLGETFPPLSVAGMALIISGVYGIGSGEKKR